MSTLLILTNGSELICYSMQPFRSHHEAERKYSYFAVYLPHSPDAVKIRVYRVFNTVAGNGLYNIGLLKSLLLG